jgi:hypothetical protein
VNRICLLVAFAIVFVDCGNAEGCRRFGCPRSCSGPVVYWTYPATTYACREWHPPERDFPAFGPISKSENVDHTKCTVIATGRTDSAVTSATMTDCNGTVVKGTIDKAGPPAWQATFTIPAPYHNNYKLEVTNSTGTSQTDISLP